MSLLLVPRHRFLSLSLSLSLARAHSPLSLSLSRPAQNNRPSTSTPSARFLPPRSSQLDAARLDSELASLVGEQVYRVLAPWEGGALPGGPAPPLPGRALLAAARPELGAALDALAFLATVGRGRPTPGMRMLNLRFADVRGGGSGARNVPPSPDLPGLSRSQRVALGLLSVGGRYAAARLSRAAAARRWAAGAAASPSSASLANTLASVDTALALGSLVNLVAFISGAGTHRSLVERVVGAAAVPADPGAPRSLSFDYLNRQLVWHGLAELMLFLLPLFEPARLGRAVGGWFPRIGGLRPAQAGGSARASPAAAAPSTSSSNPALDDRPVCGWCGRTDPPLPFAALPCTHVHCYWCLSSAVGGGEGGGGGGDVGGGGGPAPAVHCPTCGQRVVAIVRASRRRRVEIDS